MQLAPQDPSASAFVPPTETGSESDGEDLGYGRLATQNGYKKDSIHIRNFANDADMFLRQIQIPKINNVGFYIDGIPFQATYTAQGEEIRLSIWATLGYLPYSAVSIQKRRILVNMLNGIRSLPHAKFGVDQQQRIVVKADYMIPNIDLPTFIFIPLLKFIQEARPFIQLIGEAL